MNLFIHLLSAHLISSLNISLIVIYSQIPFIIFIRTNKCMNYYFISYFICLLLFNYETLLK